MKGKKPEDFKKSPFDDVNDYQLEHVATYLTSETDPAKRKEILKAL